MNAEPGCSKKCFGADRCAVGWPDGSCGAKLQGTAWHPPSPTPPAGPGDDRWRYAVMTAPGVFFGFASMAEALEYRERVKKDYPRCYVWEPMGMTACERIAAEPPAGPVPGPEQIPEPTEADLQYDLPASYETFARDRTKVGYQEGVLGLIRRCHHAERRAADLAARLEAEQAMRADDLEQLGIALAARDAAVADAGRLREALKKMVEMHAKHHSGSCCTLDGDGRVVVTNESCKCDSVHKESRAALLVGAGEGKK